LLSKPTPEMDLNQLPLIGAAYLEMGEPEKQVCVTVREAEGSD